MPKQLFVTPSRCIDCKHCELNCSFVHTSDPAKPALPRIRVYTFPGEIRSIVTCQQCEDAPCQKVCPTGALVRDPGTGAISRSEACILCKACTLACPYGNICFDAVNMEIVKCDLCGGDPACAKHCETRALVWAEEPAPDLEPEAKELIKRKLERSQEQAKIREELTGALMDGPKIVPEVAEATGMPSHEVFWWLMAMKKYGQVVEGEQRGDYFEYTLAQEQEQAK